MCPLSGPVRLLLLPVFLATGLMGQESGVRFRGDVPLAPGAPPSSPGSLEAVELPEPKPVFPGSRIIDPSKAVTPTERPAQPESAGQLPDPVPVAKDPQQANPGGLNDVPVLQDPDSINIPPPPMPPTDVPQLDNANLFPNEQQQMEAALDESSKGWKLIVHGGLRAAWDSNIFIQETGAQSDFIVTFSPGVAVGIGEFRQEFAAAGTFINRFDRTDLDLGRRFFFLDYNPSYHLYTSNSGESSLEHDIRVAGRYTFTKLTLGASARFETLNVADTDLGERISMRRFLGQIGGEYALTGKTTLEATLDHSLRDYEGDRKDITEYRATGWVAYQALPKTNVALGYTHGWVDVDNGNGQSFDQIQLRAIWKGTEKISAKVSGGMEWRGIENREDTTNATFAVGLIYKPFDATSIFINGFRRTNTSASGFNESYSVTGFDARVIQRFSQKYFLTAAGGIQTASYNENIIGFSREDDYQWTRFSLGWDVSKWLTALIAYEYRTNDSNQIRRSFEDHLFYIQFSFLF